MTFLSGHPYTQIFFFSGLLCWEISFYLHEMINKVSTVKSCQCDHPINLVLSVVFQLHIVKLNQGPCQYLILESYSMLEFKTLCKVYFFCFKMISRITAARGAMLYALPSYHVHHRLSFQIWRNYTSRNILKLEERGLWADCFPESKYASYICSLILVSLMFLLFRTH